MSSLSCQKETPAGNDLMLQKITTSDIKIKTKNTESSRNWLFDKVGRLIRLLSQFANE